jgi:hypothetical protein
LTITTRKQPRTSIVAQAKCFMAGQCKAKTKRTETEAVHSLRLLLGYLATVTRNTVAMVASPDAT